MRTNTLKAVVPVVILVDCSYSVKDIRPLIIRNLRTLLQVLKGHKLFADGKGKVLLTLVYFNHRYRVVIDTEDIMNISEEDITFEATGATNPGKALADAIDKVKTYYDKNKREMPALKHPLLFLFTDGRPDAGVNATAAEHRQMEESYKAACESIRGMQIKTDKEDRKLGVAAVCYNPGISVKAHRKDYETLCRLSPLPEQNIYDAGYNKNSLERFFTDLIPQMIIAQTLGTYDGVIDF